MKLYTKEIDGKSVYKTRSQIIIIKDDMQYINPSEDMILEDGWVEYVVPETPITPEYVPTIEDERNKMIKKILEYDSSDEVNMFYVSGIPVWLDKATRAGLILRFNAELENAHTETSLWYNGVMFPLLLDDAVKMLYAIEIYASACYDNTQRHLAELNKLENIEDINSYDYKTGYPEKLNF